MLVWQSVIRSWKSLHTCYCSALKDPCERSLTSVLKSNEIKGMFCSETVTDSPQDKKQRHKGGTKHGGLVCGTTDENLKKNITPDIQWGWIVVHLKWELMKQKS